MANKPKRGLDYFPFEIGFFDDIKVRKLIKYQGSKAIPVYTLLLCNIYKEGYYLRWDEELPFTISEKTGYDEAFIKEVIKCCLQVNLFSKDVYDQNNVLTSAGIQKRYGEICRFLKRKANVSEFKIIDSEELPKSSEELTETSEELLQKKEKEKKEKEKKEKESKVNGSETLTRAQIFNLIYKDLFSEKEKYFPEFVAKYKIQWKKLCERNLPKQKHDDEDLKLFDHFYKKPVMKEIEKMWNWYHKTDAHTKVVSWIVAMHSWLDRKSDFKR